ncbi:hypothetical protein KW807_00120 [Candidatus Parcubacteria bacterium]|nr:hypothetical protein [Candidatus Parcubacteria bacterium]
MAESQGEQSELRQIRTFQGDVARALSTQQESLVSIQQTEALRKRMGTTPQALEANLEEADAKRRRKEFLLFMIGSFTLIGFGLMGIWYGYGTYLKKTAPPTISIPNNRFISSAVLVNLEAATTTRQALIDKFLNATKEVPTGELRQIVLRKGPGNEATLVSTSEFLKSLRSRAPGSLVRAFDPLFMLGATGGVTSHRFLIIKLTSFENAYAGMLAWEPTLAEDLAPLFDKASLVKAITGTSVFKDVTSRNKDVRMLTTDELPAQSVLLYSFFDNSLLIITDDLDTLRVLIDRLSREKLSR